MKIPLASSGLRQIDIEKAIEVLNSGSLTMGKEVKVFESAMASYLQCKDFVMVNSGSSANLAIIEALLRPAKTQARLHPGDKILVPAIAWPTTIWPLIQLGLIPVFVDVDPQNLSIDLDSAQEAVNRAGNSVRGIFPIHPLGFAIPNSKLQDFAENNDLVLINDVCESLGSWSEGKHAGMCGVAASFSFYFSHHITTMEGGGIATNDSSFADDLRSIRSHGWSRDRRDAASWTEGVSTNQAKFLFISAGYNIRPMEIQAAIGTSQIRDIDEFISRRRLIAKTIHEAIKEGPLALIGSETLEQAEGSKNHSWMHLPLIVQGHDSKQRKEAILKSLEECGIETRPVLTGNFLSQPALQKISINLQSPESFPVATLISESAFLVGAHHDLDDSQVSYLCENLVRIANIFK